jgi:serine/threonine protein kinase
LDKRSDVFAVGVILYELTTGRRLFRGSDIEIMTAIVERDVMPPSRHVPNYPVELEQIVLHALQRDRSKRTVSAAHIAIALEQFYMRQGLSSGALVVSHYVRSIFPYERAHEKGMGIVQEPSTVRQTQQPAPAQADDLEAKLFADELRALGQKPATASSEAPEIISVPADMVLEEESAVQPAEAEGGAERRPDRLGLDAFDEDQSVRPVVLLSRKRKPSEQLSDGAFMSDLERRLEAEPGPTDERQTASGGSPDPVRSS